LDVKKRFTEERIIGFLREAEAGMAVKDLCRKPDSGVMVHSDQGSHFTIDDWQSFLKAPTWCQA
jgi:transposase InsO family protein